MSLDLSTRYLGMALKNTLAGKLVARLENTAFDLLFDIIYDRIDSGYFLDFGD